MAQIRKALLRVHLFPISYSQTPSFTVTQLGLYMTDDGAFILINSLTSFQLQTLYFNLLE